MATLSKAYCHRGSNRRLCLRVRKFEWRVQARGDDENSCMRAKAHTPTSGETDGPTELRTPVHPQAYCVGAKGANSPYQRARSTLRPHFVRVELIIKSLKAKVGSLRSVDWYKGKVCSAIS